jgi:hypothetical protein
LSHLDGLTKISLLLEDGHLLAPDYSEEITIGARRAVRSTQSSIAAVGSIQYGSILTG